MWFFPSLWHEEIHQGIVVAAPQTYTVVLPAEGESFLCKDITQTIVSNTIIHKIYPII